MSKKIKTFFVKSDERNSEQVFCDTKERKLLKEKVIKGTDFAVREYGEVFKKLAEYDRTLN